MTSLNFRKINIRPYKPGKSILKKKTKVIKLSANESALGMSPKASKILQAKKLTISKYPDSKANKLRKIISSKFKCEFNKIICGSGSDELIQMLCQLFLTSKDEVIVPQYSFLMYRIYASIVGAKVVFSREKEFKVSPEEIIKKVNKKTKIVFLANPNNPTGTYLNKNEMLELRKKLRSDILLVVDDAYYEYITDSDYVSGIKLFSKSKNVLITRTFSKIYGLAGLRVGWGYGPKSIIKKLYEIKPPFNVSRPALFAATQAVQDTNWLNKAIKHNNFWAEKIFDTLDEIGITTNRTNVNFFLLNFDYVNITANKVFNKLANSGILVRQMDVYGIKNSLRVTIGNSKENKKFISVLRKIFNV